MILLGPRTDTATTSVARALNFEESQKKVKNVLDMAKSTDGSTNRLQAMKAAFKVDANITISIISHSHFFIRVSQAHSRIE